MSRRRISSLLLVAVLIAALLAFAASKATSYSEVIEHGPAPEVRSTPYLAAEQFLVAQKRAVDRADNLAALGGLPPENRILLLLGERADMTPMQAEQLLEWVTNGGHLVFVAERIWDERSASSGDLLLDALGLQQYETIAEESADSSKQSGADRNLELTRLYLENEEAPAYLAFDTSFHLYDAGKKAHAWANSQGATHMLQLQHGAGLITALTDSWIWQNDRIDGYDHAWLLWYLTQDREVTFVYRTGHDSLAKQLLKHFPEALLALLLILAFTLWHLSHRLGPLIETTNHGRRQLEEHIRASADFLYRRAGQGHLLTSLQHDIMRQAQRRHPGYETLAHDQQCQVLAAFSGLTIDTIDHALRPPTPKPVSVAEFTSQVAHLQTLRNSL
ncbi:DUF4350 domain-containing protein [Stutzerimonas zhaodongensis]|uniref:DUF4350 domain-containing protein n=1 Tax=Stutzerimonas zhaodongensis TaxID=1176257 RepID=A0A3M2HMN3_9GAMM|nr:DUF4350 domain-containing protein [Stutzerimonas zhaodongensis]MCQ4315133.1 DUF4350 domain-containing protein [Stutzerimonas zhaodongensis]RMH90288.1 DUF4350 domain-containing protein [Stutzerimonas zhaodongensis]